MAGYTQAWGTTLLRRLGAPVTPENLRFLDAWSRAEGGQAKNNPFNTTQNTPGSVRRPGNTAGVRDYPSPAAGLDATYLTLTNGRYDGILSSLRAGAPATATARQVAASPWGTGSGVSRVLGDTGGQSAQQTSGPDWGSLLGNPNLPGVPNVGGAVGGALSGAIGSAIKPVLTFVLYLVMMTGGAALMLLGLLLLVLSTRAGKDAAEAGVVAAAPEAAPEVAAARSSSGGGVPRDPDTGLTPSQAATAQHRERVHADRMSLAQQRRADAAARERRARAERTRVRTAREREKERDRSARVVGDRLGVVGLWDPTESERPAPRRRTAGQPLSDTPPY